MDEAKRKQIAWYDHVAAVYDQHHLPLSPRVAELVVSHAIPAEGMRVLDVGTGTGNVALAAARRVGRRGLVVGVDLSASMLQEARRRACGLPIEFHQMDAEALGFGDATFDVVVSSLLAGVHVVRALREMHRVLRPGERVVFASYTDQTHEPLQELTWSRMERHGLPRPAPPTGAWTALSETERFRSWFESAGFQHVEALLEPYAFVLEDPEDWWSYMRRSTRWGPVLARLSPSDFESLHAGIVADIEGLRSESGVQVDASAIIAIGVRPGRIAK